MSCESPLKYFVYGMGQWLLSTYALVSLWTCIESFVLLRKTLFMEEISKPEPGRWVHGGLSIVWRGSHPSAFLHCIYNLSQMIISSDARFSVDSSHWQTRPGFSVSSGRDVGSLWWQLWQGVRPRRIQQPRADPCSKLASVGPIQSPDWTQPLRAKLSRFAVTVYPTANPSFYLFKGFVLIWEETGMHRAFMESFMDGSRLGAIFAPSLFLFAQWTSWLPSKARGSFSKEAPTIFIQVTESGWNKSIYSWWG